MESSLHGVIEYERKDGGRDVVLQAFVVVPEAQMQVPVESRSGLARWFWRSIFSALRDKNIHSDQGQT